MEEDSGTYSSDQKQADRHLDTQPMIREQDRFLPIANVSRIMKRGVPSAAKISKGAKETIQECVSELIGFVTSEASELIHEENRKTITSDDLVTAMEKLGFGPYIPYLQQVAVQAKNANPRKSGSKRSLSQSQGSSEAL